MLDKEKKKKIRILILKFEKEKKKRQKEGKFYLNFFDICRIKNNGKLNLIMC